MPRSERLGRPVLDRRVVLRYERPSSRRETGARIHAALIAQAGQAAPAVPAGVPPAVPAAWTAWNGRDDPPVTATATLPFVFVSEVAPDADAWAAPRLFEAVLRADMRERPGDETERASAILTTTVAAIYLRERDVLLIARLAGASFEAKPWTLRVLHDPNRPGYDWDLQSVARVWRRGPWMRLLAQRRQ